MSVSIIVPTWNGLRWIADCLHSIECQHPPDAEIIVVDNASTDGTPDRVAGDFPQVTLLRLDRNYGFAGGVNRGLAVAHGDTVALLNQDVVLRDGCLQALCARLAQSGPAIVGCKLLYPDEQTIQHAGGIIRYPRAVPDHHGYRQIDKGQWSAAADVDYVTGAVFAFDRRVWHAIGQFDEGFFPANYEEVDFCYRARAAGFRVIYEPAAVAIHWESQTQNTRSLDYLRTMERGRLRFVLKNYRPDQLVDFWKAEKEFISTVPTSFARDVLVSAYFDALRNVSAINPHTISQDAISDIITNLYDLRLSALRLTETREDKLDNQLHPIRLPVLHEHNFRSSVPVIGPLISFVRRGLYTFTAKWALMVLIDQQNHVNDLIAQYLNRLQEFDARLIEQDRDLTHLARSLTETQIQLRSCLKAIESPSPIIEARGTQSSVSPGS